MSIVPASRPQDSPAHPLGPLAENLTHVSRYQVGQDAMHAAFGASRAGRYAQAARWFQLGAHVADVLAAATGTADVERAAHWRLVAEVRRRLAADAVPAAFPLVPEVIGDAAV